jgi:ribulose-phosphate 3-epimerase
MKGKIAPSVMCIDVWRFAETMAALEEKQVEYLHIDVMDGHFVPNYALGTDICRMIRKRTSIPFDFHLMTDLPLLDVERFDIRPGDIVSVHAEGTPQVMRVLDRIAEKGARPFLALNPGTPLSVLEETVEAIDGLLIMTVNPGFSGQKAVPHTIKKIARARAELARLGRPELEIEVDGNVSFANARLMADAGADIFVAGSSSVFRSDLTAAEGVDMLRLAI